MSAEQWSYDLIAEVYATDMGQSMPFDDVAFYRQQCSIAAGRMLELGCGTGRILLPLIRAGFDMYGIDRSLPMLKRLCRDAAALGLAPPPVAQMNLDALALAGPFAVVLAPYSLITYVTDPVAVRRLLREIATLLHSDGTLVLDAFIPQPVVSYADFRLDYRRPHADGALERSKRIEALADGTNHIVRRYRLFGPDGSRGSEFETDERIRPYSPEDLATMANDAGFVVTGWTFDYGGRADARAARFASVAMCLG